MGKLLALVVLLAAVLVGYVIKKDFYQSVALPPVKDEYFGAGAQRADKTAIEAFKVNVPNATLDDLRSRLQNSRFFDPLEEAAFHYGFNSEYLKSVQSYWLNKFDWRQQEAKINAFDHFKTEIEGLKVHFIHAKADRSKYKAEQIRTVLIVHGWPGSVFEFYKIIPMFTDPKAHGWKETSFAFDVVAPSIPGYGWSEAPKKKGFGTIAAARIFNKLMGRLGYTSFYTQGGDWGAIITKNLAQMFPERVKGVHLNMVWVPSHNYPTLAVQHILGAFIPSLFLSAQDYQKVYPLTEKFMTLLQETGYFHIQATKPDTVGFSLNDSPLGLAAYVLEKFSTWTHLAYRDLKDGGVAQKFTLDELLTNVMIYWTTGTIGSSQRLYKECFQHPDYAAFEKAPVLSAVGIAMFPQELVRTPRSWLAYKYHNIVTYTDMPRGGHFAAFEEPKLLATDFQNFVSDIEYFPKQ